MKPAAAAALAALALAACGSSSSPGVQGAPAQMVVTSPELQGQFPASMTCDGANRAPALVWSGAPAATRSFVVEMTDQDSANGSFTHWLVYNIPAGTASLGSSLPPGAVEGKNDFGRQGYGGPCPPKGAPPHHYTIAVYALNQRPQVPAGESRAQLEAAIQVFVIGTGTLESMYQRQ